MGNSVMEMAKSDGASGWGSFTFRSLFTGHLLFFYS